MEFHTRGIEDYSDEELYTELERRKIDKEIIRLNTLNINKITVKDFVVEIDEPAEGYGPYFVFYIKRGSKKYCIWYDYNQGKPQKWWPVDHYEKLENAAFEFIPKGFSESVENGYEYDNGSVDDGIEYLKKCGFWNIKKIK